MQNRHLQQNSNFSTHVSPRPTADDLVVLWRLEALDGEEVEDGLEAVRGQKPPLQRPTLRLLAAHDPESGWKR